MDTLLAELDEQGAFFDGLSGGREHPQDLAGGRRFDWHLHLHGFQDDDGLPLDDRVANRDLDLPDSPGNVRVHGRSHASGRVGIVANVVKAPRSKHRRRPTLLMGWCPALRRLLASVVLTMLMPAGAGAHPETVPALVNRYITLLPTAGQLEIDVVLLFGTLPAAEQRRSRDADQDGVISAAELAMDKKRWGQRAADMVTISIDGHRRHLGYAVEVDLNGKTGVDREPLVVQLRGRVPLQPGEHRLIVEPGPDLPRMGETEIVLEAGHPWLLHAGVLANGQSTPGQSSIKYAGPRSHPGESRHAGFIVRSHGPLDAVAPGPSIVVPALLVGLSILLGAALMFLFGRLGRKRSEKT